MPDSIVDGSGQNNKARVGSSLKLDVSARVNDRIYYASRNDKKAFIVQMHLTQASGAATEAIGYLKYTGSERINIKQITVTSEDPGMTAFGIWKNPTVSGGTELTPVNLNFSSNIPSDTEAKDSQSTITITDGESIQTIRMDGPDSKVIDLYDAVILGTNNIIAIKGQASTTGSKIRVNIMFAESVD